MATPIKVSDRERTVLAILAEHYDGEGTVLYSRYVAVETKLPQNKVLAACRALARKGLAIYLRGCMDEDGMAAGSGYCATEKGAAFISHCDLCERRNVYDYEGVKECELHYKQSPKQLSIHEA